MKAQCWYRNNKKNGYSAFHGLACPVRYNQQKENPEYALKKKVRWSMNSNQGVRYIKRAMNQILVRNLLTGFGAGVGYTAINIAALKGTKKGEEGLASGLINTSRQIGGPIGLAVLLTVANFETPGQTDHLVHSGATTMILVRGFGYAFVSAAIMTGIGIIFTEARGANINCVEIVILKSYGKHPKPRLNNYSCVHPAG